MLLITCRSTLGLALAWLPFAVSCGRDAGSRSADASQTASPKPSTPAKATARAAGTSTSASPATVPESTAAASKSLSAEEFCAQAVKLGEENLARCADSERANVPAMGHVKDLKLAKEECSMRIKSANVEYHGDAADRCIEAARKHGGMMTFFRFLELPACSGVLTGKATEGKPVKFAEECAAGLTMFRNRCIKPAAKNARCEDYSGGILGKSDEHPRCEHGLDCFLTKEGTDGYEDELSCMTPSDAGATCQLHVNTCAQGSTCYQGKCRAKAASGGDCMRPADCGPGLECEIKGGVFGKCVESRSASETCHERRP